MAPRVGPGSVLDEMLRADLAAPPKQRQTTHRVWERLVDEHGKELTGGESTFVDRWWHLIPTNPRMFTDFIRLTNMLAGPAILLQPRHLTKALAPR